MQEHYKPKKNNTVKDITVVYSTKTGEQRVILTMVETSQSAIQAALRDVSCNTAIAYRVERIEISKKELKTA